MLNCAICEHNSFHVLWDLPALPLTEKHGPFSPETTPGYDQQLLSCAHCGHVQLAHKLDPDILYTPSAYAYRTSQSSSTRGGCQFFHDFVLKVKGQETFQSLLDIGGNDFYLAKMLAPLVTHTTVIDPICTSQDGQVIDGLYVLGRFVEDVNLHDDIPTPDLVICRHVLEHISQPKDLFIQLFEQCSPETLYVFEIPCFDMLVEASRFDAIFHQHYHYYDIDILKKLIFEAGGEYVQHAHHYQGPCGGSLLVAFRKAKVKQIKPTYDTQSKIQKRQEAIVNYQSMMQSLGRQLHSLHGQIYGYGASLMLATLSYHLQNDLSGLICILDDDASKDGWGYQNVPVTVRWTSQEPLQPHSNFLITSLENIRPIFQRVLKMTPRRILLPGII